MDDCSSQLQSDIQSHHKQIPSDVSRTPYPPGSGPHPLVYIPTLTVQITCYTPDRISILYGLSYNTIPETAALPASPPARQPASLPARPSAYILHRQHRPACPSQALTHSNHELLKRTPTSRLSQIAKTPSKHCLRTKHGPTRPT